MMNNVPTNSKVVCVTGSAKRIGAAIVQQMHSLGFCVVIHCHQSTCEAQALATKLNDIRQHSAKVVQADLTDSHALQQLAAAVVACFGRLDVLVHNASRFYPTALDASASELEQAWQELFASNAKAPFMLTQLLKNELEKQQGCVISLLDIHANDRPFQGYSIYNMAKAAHRMLVKTLAVELAPQVRVNGIAPGANIWPEMASDQAIAMNTQHRIRAAIPLQRVGEPQDIAHAVAYLAQANYVTGHVINVDGGRSLTLAGGEPA